MVLPWHVAADLNALMMDAFFPDQKTKKRRKSSYPKYAPDTYADELLESLIVPAKITSGLLKKCAPHWAPIV